MSADSPCVIFDIDGTLADNTHRSPFDYAECHADAPIERIVELANVFTDAGYELVFVSGREGTEETRQKTAAWLGEHVIGTSRHETIELHMRAAGDYRGDDTVKRELYDAHLADRDIRFVVDDRRRVIRMWRALGLTVLDVAGNTF
jgi:phosphoglycolate phosphatase-like HAD superfamily hydrolase